MNKKVMIFSLEKTGTSTVKRTIDTTGIAVDRVHPHTVDNFDFSLYTHFITLVRDPVARAISSHFEYNMKNDIEKEIDKTLTWFDDYIKPMSGINVYSTFRYIQGWKIYSENMLVIRTDSLSSALVYALRDLLQIPSDNFTFVEGNRTKDKHGDVYNEFVNTKKWDSTLLNSIYNHKYCKLFWSDTENEYFMKKWRRK